MDITPIFLTLKLATVTTLVLLVCATPLAWWLSRGRSWPKRVVETVVALPLVLPPSVLGFYMLLALAPNGPLGRMATAAGLGPLAFTFTGLVVGSVLFSLPFVVRPLQDAFAGVGEELLEAAATLGAGPWDRFVSVALPLARHGYLTAATLGFAHTVGEFGVVLMIGGNIPGQTQVLSIAIYDAVEVIDYPTAHLYSAGLLVFSFVTLLTLSLASRRGARW
ncbi:MAG: molybdate ABC transporter permease subunit [Nitrospinae bacterium]|nr:molybdate ABC transporter permease subunit [Nitrospinota bacterium]